AMRAGHVDEVSLPLRQSVVARLRERRPGEQHADGAVQLVDGSVGLHPGAVLANTAAVAKARGAVIPGAGVDLAQTVAHWPYPIRICHRKNSPPPSRRPGLPRR